MATQLDLQEQEQLDELKAFWKQYGNLITWVLVAVLAAFAGWNLWNRYQADQAGKASALFDQLTRAADAGNADMAVRAFGDLQSRYPHTAFTEQGGLLAAKVAYEKGKPDAARTALTWVAGNATEDEYRTIAHLRLAGLLLDQKQPDEAMKQLDAADAKGFEPLVADRRGDVLMAQGKKEEAKAAYQAAFKGIDEKQEYRRLVEAKLTALGAAPAAPAASAGAAQ